jgi:SHS2 domain-containing protein
VTTRAADLGAGVREIEHTADLGLEVEAPTLALLFERAGLAAMALMLDLDAIEPRTRATIALSADGVDELLHDWLQTLVVRLQTDGLAFAELTVEAVDGCSVRAEGVGERVDRRRHRAYTEIKGVTYHQLAVRETRDGWWARVIFDV